jgi:hypothetical protein
MVTPAYPNFCHESSLGPISITPRGPKGCGQTRRVSSVLTARRAAPSDEYAQAGSRRRLAGSGRRGFIRADNRANYLPTPPWQDC